jgi:hypothetical protein
VAHLTFELESNGELHFTWLRLVRPCISSLTRGNGHRERLAVSSSRYALLSERNVM